ELGRLVGAAQEVSRDGRRLVSRAGHTLTLWEIAPGREYLPLPGSAASVGSPLFGVSPNGRWLVAGQVQCGVWDLALRKKVASLPLSGMLDARFHPNGREFFTSGDDGLFRWSFETGEGGVRIRPISRLLPPGRLEFLSLDRDGRLIAV